MFLILAEDTLALPDQSELWAGRDQDVYRIKRKLVVPFSPRLRFVKGESSSEWTIVTKILAGISWNSSIHLRQRNVEDAFIPMANVLLVEDGSDKRNKLLQLFLGTIQNDHITEFPSGGFVKIKLGNSASIDFTKGTWVGPGECDDFQTCSSDNYFADVKLTEKQVSKLVTIKDKDIRVSLKYSFERLNLKAEDFCRRILITGDLSDFEVVSNQGEVTRCHKAVLIERSSKLKKIIEDGSRKLDLELSTVGVGAFLGNLYHGGLSSARENLDLAVELLNAADLYKVLGLWNDLVGLFIEKELSVKVAVGVFNILVNAEKVDSHKELVCKLLPQNLQPLGLDCSRKSPGASRNLEPPKKRARHKD